MKKLLLFMFIFTLTATASGQKLIIGERAPELKIAQWMDNRSANMNRPRLIEFFHSSYNQRDSQIAELGRIAEEYKNRVDVIIVTRESPQIITPILNVPSHRYFVAFDDQSKSFNNFSVRYIPFSVLVDGRGRVIWFGNSASLQDDVIDRSLK